MKIGLTRIDKSADVYDVRKAVPLALHDPDLFGSNDQDENAHKPNFEIETGKNPAGRICSGKAILHVATKLGRRLFKWIYDMVNAGRPLRLFNAHRDDVSPNVQQIIEKALYIDPDQDKLRTQIGTKAREVHLRIEKLQFGVWYKPPNSSGKGRSFSIEYERDFIQQSAASVHVAYDHKLIHINIDQWETEENNYKILVKFSNIRKLGLGYDEFEKPFIIFDLFNPPSFEQESYNNRVPEGVVCKGKHKTRDRIHAIDDLHATIAPYAHHLRILLVDPDDLVKFEKICHTVQCEPRPLRVRNVDANAMKFFSPRNLFHIQCWVKTMEWKDAFQIEAYLRCGLLNTYDLLVTLQKPIEEAILYYGDEASQFLREFFMALKDRKVDEEPSACFARMRSKFTTIKPTQLTPGHVFCHHVVITPSRMFLEGPYPTQSNCVIRRYKNHAERFIRVEFRDEDHLGYRWDSDVDGTWFLQQRVGEHLRHGFELGGLSFEFLVTSGLRDHSFWFVAPFRDPVEGYVTAEKIRASLGDFSKLLRTPSKYAARIAQAFNASDPSVKIQLDQWEEQDDIGPEDNLFTDGVGTISPQLADMIWETKCRASRNSRENSLRVKPSPYQLGGIKMRLRPSQRKFPAHDVEEAVFEITGSFDFLNPVHPNRPVAMALEGSGVKEDTSIVLQEKAMANIYPSEHSFTQFSAQLKKHRLGSKFHLASVLEQLYKLGLDFEDKEDKKAIKSAFLECLLRFSINHSLREVKFRAQIPVPESYQLVGVADEGRTYIMAGANESDVYTLDPGQIYVSVQKSLDEDPIYLKGPCVISRRPVIHPGDVGKPPEDKICFFAGLKNVVVLPAHGPRPLGSCLAGGDLVGDTYDIYYNNPGLLPLVHADPAEYSTGPPFQLAEDQGDATVEDINSDVVDLLADRHTVIPDQSKDGLFDPRCMRLAELCSQGVDYAQNGNPVDIYNNRPRPLIKFKPDWHKAEVTGTRELDYNISDRALGHLYRNIELNDTKLPIKDLLTEHPGETAPLQDLISRAIKPLIQHTLNTDGTEQPDREDEHTERVHEHYVREMRYTCVTHTLVDKPDVRLTEEEIVLGTILANCTHPRWRLDKLYRMRLHVGGLLAFIRTQVVKSEGEGELTDEELRAGLSQAWKAWVWAQHHRDREFIESYSLILLGIIFDCLRNLGGLEDG